MTQEDFKDKRAAFVKAYEEWWRFNPREAADWWELVDKIPKADYPRLVTTVRETWGQKVSGPPRGEFRKAWWRIRPQTVQAEEKPPLDYCGLCEDSGRMWAIGRWEPDGKGFGRYRLVDTPHPDGPIYRYVVPCVCPLGDRFKHLATQADRDMVLRWRRDVLPGLAAERGVSETLGTPEKWCALDMLAETNRKAFEKPARAPVPDAAAPEATREVEAAAVAGEATEAEAAPVVEAVGGEKKLVGGYREEEIPF
jgi:hypothetical protein